MPEDRIAQARHRVRELRSFYVHVTMYVVVMAGLALINWITTPNFWWVLFPMVFWGIGVAAHAISVIFEGSVFGAEWEERKTRELLSRRSE